VPADRAPRRPRALTVAEAARQAVRELMRVSGALEALSERYRAAGHQLFLVGGSVRDALLGRLGEDLDFTTDASPETTLRLVRGLGTTWTTGMEFGTVGVLVNVAGEHRCEITTFRTDRYDADSRKPVVEYGDSIDGDLSRRDFTVNAMAVPLPLDAARPVVDPFGGLEDLTRRLLRTPVAAEQSFDDDPLRMLRAARFAAQLEFEVSPDAVDAIDAMAPRLAIVSAERIRDELSKLVLGSRPRAGLQLLVDTGLAEQCLPEVAKLKETVDEHGRHKDVYAHTLTVLEQAIALEDDGPDLVLRLAALLHDIGKPKTKSVGPGGKVSFHHHEVVGAAMARQRLQELRYPKDVVDDVSRLVELHLRFHGYADGDWTASAVRRYVRDAGSLLGRLHKLTRSDCTTRNAAKARALSTAYDSLEQRIAVLEEQEDLERLRPDLDGNRIMSELGIGPGPLVGEAYRYLLELRMEHGPLGEERAIEELQRWAREQGIAPPSEGKD
jgi:poly(A) polymerase